VGPMSHDWLLPKMMAVCHHGGAGTTSAGLRYGKPTFICPFFGDQHFWAEMIFRAGAGPRGCPVTNLTEDKLEEAFRTLINPETVRIAQELGQKMLAEDGIAEGVASFHRNLPLDVMVCEVSLFNDQKSVLANTYCEDCGFKMCFEVNRVLHRPGGGRTSHTRVKYRPCKWANDSKWSNLYDYIALPSQLKGQRVILPLQKSQQTVSFMGLRKSGNVDFSKVVDEDDVGLELTPEEAAIERAYIKAKDFLELWGILDSTGDRNLNEAELAKHMSVEEAAHLISVADTNNDGVLSFAELAWKFAEHTGISSL